MFVAFFNKYKTYIYLVSIVGIICILTMEHSIIEEPEIEIQIED